MDSGAYDIVQPGCRRCGRDGMCTRQQMAHTRGSLSARTTGKAICGGGERHLLAASQSLMLESNMTPIRSGGALQRVVRVKKRLLHRSGETGLGVELKRVWRRSILPLQVLEHAGPRHAAGAARAPGPGQSRTDWPRPGKPLPRDGAANRWPGRRFKDAGSARRSQAAAGSWKDRTTLK